MFDLVSNDYMLQMMDRSMTLATQRMTVIASNLANIDTPNYRTQDFSFEDAFKQEVASLDRQFSPASRSTGGSSYFTPSRPAAPVPTDSTSTVSERNDLNDVSLDQQTMALAKTQNLYQLSSNFAQAELRRVLGAIRDGAK